MVRGHDILDCNEVRRSFERVDDNEEMLICLTSTIGRATPGDEEADTWTPFWMVMVGDGDVASFRFLDSGPDFYENARTYFIEAIHLNSYSKTENVA